MKVGYIRGTRYTIYEDGTVISPFGRKLKPWESSEGYLLIRIRKDKRPLCLRLHRILAESFKDNPENKPFVRHLNDVKNDNRLCNLEWGDNITNTQEGYDNNCYSFPNRRSYGIVAISNDTGTIYKFKSIRSCAEALSINRKNVTSILKRQKVNKYDYTFEYFEIEC